MRAAGRTQARAAKDSRQTTAVHARPVRGKTTPKNSSKEKIAAAAQNTAAEKGGSSGKPGKVESPNKNGKKDDKKDNAAEKKAQAQIEELQRAISGLELEKKELEKQLRNLGGKPAAGNATGSNDELQKKMKKLEEDKQKAESLLEALKNQK